MQFSDPKSIELELEWSLVHTIIGKVKNISRPGLRSLKYYFGNVAYILDAVTSSGILKAKQKLGVTFILDKQDIIDFMKFSKMTMCRTSEANS